MSIAPAVPVEAEEGCGLRERKKQQTRKALHRAALEMVTARGMAQVTTEEIAERVGVSPRTFFNYFPTKESAVLGIGPDAPERVGNWLRERPADETPVVAARVALTRFAAELHADKELWALRRTLVRSDPSVLQAMAALSSAVERSATEALAERMGIDVDDDVWPSLVVSVTWAAIRVALNYARDHSAPIESALDDAFALLDDIRPARSADPA